MSSRAWEPDRPLTDDGAAAAIRACFPTVDSRAVRHLGSGWEFDVYATVDGWVFRFPRRAHCADLFEPESRVHHLVSLALPPRIAVPHVELVGRPAAGFPYRFAGHRYIAGVHADAVAPELLPTLAWDLGAALGAIHSIPEEWARAAGVVEMDVDDVGRKEWLERGVDIASALRGLDPVVDQAVSWANTISLPIGRFDGPLRFIHQDLSPEHFIVDAATGHLTGILDWTDAMLGDAARDFVVLVTWRGWEFAEQVLRHYPHPADGAFRERLDFMARLLSVIWLANASEQQADVPKHIRWVHNAFASPDTSGQPTRDLMV
jgi:aminoglycoside phosphotransferase (APT) family kinase protein